MIDVIIIANFVGDLLGTDNNRFIYIADMLSKRASVELITSSFYHTTKKKRTSSGEALEYKVTLLEEPGYKKNVSVQRMRSHAVFGKNLAKYLEKRNKPDVIYCAVPTLDAAWEAAKYAKKNKVRFVIDVQDLWPEAFKMVFHVPILSDLIFTPMQMKANRIYSAADQVVAVSKTYADRAMRVNRKCQSPSIVYLGTDKDTFDGYTVNSLKKEESITIVYVGSMSASYDIISVIDAISNINIGVSIKLLAMGDGELKDKFVEYAKQKSIDAEFTGRLSYPCMVERLMLCDIAVNPIHKGSAGSIVNKVGDYAMAGLPVINTQECIEYRNLLEQYEAGINCECENSIQVSNAIIKLIEDKKLRKQMSSNARQLGVERFNRANAYQNLVDILLTNEVGVIRIAYCGTLGHSYDIGCVIEAISYLDKTYRNRIEFIVMGDGPKMEVFSHQAEGLPIKFIGRIPYPEMVWILKHCDIAVNPITKGAAQSIINKHMDYAMAGLPVINTQECKEYCDLVSKYNMGFNCANGSVKDLADKLVTLIDNEYLRCEMGKNARKCAVECFDRRNTYNEIVDVIDN